MGAPTAIVVRATQVINATPEEILELVMDIERYAEVDEKIRPVLWSTRDGDLTEFECRSKVGGVPGPKIIQQMRRTPGRRIDIELAPAPRNRLARAMADFHASFECVPVEGATRVDRTLEFRLHRPTSWILGPILRRRLPAQVEEELLLAKQRLETPPPEPGSAQHCSA